MRVKRGLVRTFQINTLFPNLTALEAVTLAVCERRGDAGNWRRSLPSYDEAIDEAYGILTTLLLGDDCERPTRQLAYGQQRLLEIALALAARPKVLLLDEPAAGVPKDESGELFKAVAGISSDITVLFIEHDMDVVFRFASRIIVMVSGGILVEGTPDGNRRRRARPRSLSGRRTMAEPLLELRGVRAGYGDSVVLDDVSFELPENGSLALLGRNGVGKSTTVPDHHGLHDVPPRQRDLARPGHHRHGAASAGAARHRLGGAGARDFSVADASKKISPWRRGPGAGRCDASIRLLPRLKERQQQHGQSALRRRTADAGDRARR